MRNQVDISSQAMAETTEKKLLDDSREGGAGSRALGLLAAAAKAFATPAEPAPAPVAEQPAERTVRVFTGSLKDKVQREIVSVDGRVAVASAPPHSAARSGADRLKTSLLLQNAEKKRPAERKPSSGGEVPVLPDGDDE